MKSPSETHNLNRVGVPPHVPKVGGWVIVLKTPWRGSGGSPDLIGWGVYPMSASGGYTPCPRVGGATLLSSGGCFGNDGWK